MKLNYYFPTPIWWDNLSFDNKLLLSYCNDLQQQDPKGRELSNFGGWQSCDLLRQDSLILQNFASTIEEAIQSCAGDYGIDNSKHKLVVANLWFSVNNELDYNQVHIHGGSFLSGTYYLKVPDGAGEIVFYRNYMEEHFITSIPAQLEQITDINASTCRYQPRENKFVIFPSYVQHSVLPSKEGERISLSFNIRIENV
jgi:uncharacterized protein (TIGR02466 family)